MAPASLSSNYSLVFRFPNSVTALSNARSSLQRKTMTELFKDVGALLTNLLLTVIVKSMSFGPVQGG